MTGPEFNENLFVAWDTLRARKGRSALTILGIVIGVTSVIAVASIIDGLNGFVKDRISKLGARTFFVARIPMGFQNPNGRLPPKIRVRKYIGFDDARYIEETCPGLEYATSFTNRMNFLEQTDEIRYGNAYVEKFFIRGVEPEYTYAIPLFSVAEGRFISQYDLEHDRSVAVIGQALADSLFPMSDPIGKEVRINGRPYEVIGIFEKDPGLFGGFGVDQFVCIPITNFHKNYPEVKEVFIAASVRPDSNMAVARDQVLESMRRRRHVKFNDENDFEIADPDFLGSLWNQLTGALVLLTGIISSIGLLVGGIGVMNIMLISVTERTSEIGIRKAIGARRADIRIQFLLEAIVLSCIGGCIGIVLGGLIALLVRTFVPSIPAFVSLFWVILGFAISVGVGLFFGYYPANRAANLDPIVCLRYE
jgi:putative ABC transport system permease protein